MTNADLERAATVLAEKLESTRADLAAARAEIERLNQRLVTFDMKSREWMRERCAQYAEHIADNYDGWEPPHSVAGNIASGVRKLPLMEGER